MNIPDISSNTSTKSCVVYDKTTGKIVHSHSVVYIEGGEEPTLKEIEEAAFVLACECTGRKRSELRVIHLPTEKLETDAELKVDLKKNEVVELLRK